MIRIRIRKKLNMADGASNLIFDAELPLQNITALYGPSGAGKTTLLKIIAGLIHPEDGFIEVNGEVWLDTSKKISMPPQQRNIGFVFQDYALFPNMTVRQNLRYAAGKNADEALISHLLNLTGLSTFANHKPETLSGGQKQRTALARALIRKPSLLLLDEPLSALDNENRVQLQQELLQLHDEYKFSALLVSHDIAEVYHLTSRILSIDKGRILKAGTPAHVFGLTENESIKLFGQVISTDGDWMTVLLDQRLHRVKRVEALKVGDRVSVELGDVEKMI
ncbi:ATP-binding cassette domain-containing protein [Mucilaginibacter jinjuensis]|uniref:ATP-binding cassette domain-containing protein n=1 Tax=Mucilaginibacter jinjuensis TaxID=1176721 RepID=A0ABY7TFV1_9SPHI|nr:ATP-binding cassette domain-containing protein [Mucilaginibacter jinjuensis]WCT14032.1 ATP-binding cassette domain-containing protein [Mucilaginibacter jinjuensis]